MNSMFTVTGQVLKTFIQPGQTNKETGEIAPSSIKVQIMGEMPVMGGESKLDLITLTIQDKQTYDNLSGKTIRVPLGFFAPQKGSVIYFIPKGSIPELVQDRVLTPSDDSQIASVENSEAFEKSDFKQKFKQTLTG